MKMERRFRLRLINTLSGFKSVNLVGTVDSAGNENLAIISSVIHLGSDPALMGFISRPAFVERNTFFNIKETSSFTFNHINEAIYKKAHQTSARYPKEISEFDQVGLTPIYKDNFKAPFVKESPVQIGLIFREKVDIKLNDTILIIGEIQSIYVPEHSLHSDGFLDIEKAGSITCSGLDSYHLTNQIARLSYAKPNKELIEI